MEDSLEKHFLKDNIKEEEKSLKKLSWKIQILGLYKPFPWKN